MRDIITIALIRCAPLWDENDRDRMEGFVRAAARRGADLAVFPVLAPIRSEWVVDAAAAYQIAVAYGEDGPKTVLCLPDRSIFRAETDWNIVPTPWGPVALCGSDAGQTQGSIGVRLALCSRADDRPLSAAIPPGEGFFVWVNPAGYGREEQFCGSYGVIAPDQTQRHPPCCGADVPSMLLLTLDLSEAEVAG